MPYPLSEADKTAIGKALALYYEEALEAGYRTLFDRMARANMGIVTGYLDQAKRYLRQFAQEIQGRVHGHLQVAAEIAAAASCLPTRTTLPA